MRFQAQEAPAAPPSPPPPAAATAPTCTPGTFPRGPAAKMPVTAANKSKRSRRWVIADRVGTASRCFRVRQSRQLGPSHGCLHARIARILRIRVRVSAMFSRAKHAPSVKRQKKRHGSRSARGTHNERVPGIRARWHAGTPALPPPVPPPSSRAPAPAAPPRSPPAAPP